MIFLFPYPVLIILTFKGKNLQLGANSFLSVEKFCKVNRFMCRRSNSDIFVLPPFQWSGLLMETFLSFKSKTLLAIVYPFTVELQWLKHLRDHGNMFEIGVIRADE